MHISISKKLPRPSAVPGEISIVNLEAGAGQQQHQQQQRRKKPKVRPERSFIEEVFFPTNKTMCALAMGSVMILLLLIFNDNLNGSNHGDITEKELTDWLDNIRGNDNRLFRWDATPLTIQRRGHGGCAKLPEAAAVIMDHNNNMKLKTIAAEYLTFCVTDAPTQRTRFSRQEGIHQAVIQMLKDPKAAVVAAHLIYSSTFANPKNHQTYIEQGAVEALAKIIMDKNSITSEIMWAAAALQNLAASYCATADDGRCYWEWTLDEPNVMIEESSLPMISNGSHVRQEMLQTPGLVETLIKMACTGPVEGSFHNKDNVFPGENAVMGRDDNNPHLIAWAATGALKNLALEPLAKPRIEPVLPCMCRMKDSPDWLEQHKSHDLILFLRRQTDPCWYNNREDGDAGAENGSGGTLLCIDYNFVDQEHYHCNGYRRATPQECKNECIVTGITAAQACCDCGGGTKFPKGSLLLDF